MRTCRITSCCDWCEEGDMHTFFGLQIRNVVYICISLNERWSRLQWVYWLKLNECKKNRNKNKQIGIITYWPTDSLLLKSIAVHITLTSYKHIHSKCASNDARKAGEYEIKFIANRTSRIIIKKWDRYAQHQTFNILYLHTAHGVNIHFIVVISVAVAFRVCWLQKT